MFIFSKANSPEVVSELDLQNTTLKCLVPATNDLVSDTFFPSHKIQDFDSQEGSP